jgi:aminopeptidase N
VQSVTDPDGSLAGWIATKDGAFVVGEPQGSPAWYPCNDTPRDKATYDFRVRVPHGLTAVANGDLVSTKSKHGWTRLHWHNGEPMSTYLATATIGKFRVRTGTTPGRVPYYVALDPTVATRSRAVVDKLPAVTDYFASIYGPYPFSSTGVIVDHAPNVGYALETQTKPIYDRPPDELTLAHEAAHMYFGDSVTPKKWRDIWLAEGFAEFSSWMWSEHTGGETAQQFFDGYFKEMATSSILGAAARPTGWARQLVLQLHLCTRRHDPAGVAGQDRKRGLLRPVEVMARGTPARQRHPTRLPSLRGAPHGCRVDALLRCLAREQDQADVVVTGRDQRAARGRR